MITGHTHKHKTDTKAINDHWPHTHNIEQIPKPLMITGHTHTTNI